MSSSMARFASAFDSGVSANGVSSRGGLSLKSIANHCANVLISLGSTVLLLGSVEQLKQKNMRENNTKILIATLYDFYNDKHSYKILIKKNFN